MDTSIAKHDNGIVHADQSNENDETDGGTDANSFDDRESFDTYNYAASPSRSGCTCGTLVIVACAAVVGTMPLTCLWIGACVQLYVDAHPHLRRPWFSAVVVPVRSDAAIVFVVTTIAMAFVIVCVAARMAVLRAGGACCTPCGHASYGYEAYDAENGDEPLSPNGRTGTAPSVRSFDPTNARL